MKCLYFPLILLALLWVGLVETQITFQTNPQLGKFKSPSGLDCMWLNLKANESELNMLVGCWCNVSDEERRDYGCSYVTPIKKCNKEADKFFEKLVAQLKGNTLNIYTVMSWCCWFLVTLRCNCSYSWIYIC